MQQKIAAKAVMPFSVMMRKPWRSLAENIAAAAANPERLPVGVMQPEGRLLLTCSETTFFVLSCRSAG